MALDTAPKLTRNKNLGFGLETTTGTPVAIAAAQGVTNIFEPKMEYKTEAVPREGQGSTSPIVQARGARGGSVTFSVEMVGFGASGSLPAWVNLLLCCGASLTGSVITPLTNSIQTATIAYWINGRKKMLSGCAGNPVFKFKRGQKTMIDFTFQGVQQPVTDTTQILPTYLTSPTAARGLASLSYNSVTTLRVPDITWDWGNNVTLREDLIALDTNSESTGYRNAIVTNCNPTLKFSPEATPIATLDVYLLERNATLAALTLVSGSVAFNTFTLSAPKVQIIDSPADGDRGGLYTDDLTLLMTRNAAAGDDHFSLTAS